MTDPRINAFIKNAIAEDIGDGDHSSLSCIPSTAIGKAQLLIKQDGIIAGIEIAIRVFKTIDSELKIEQFLFDGNEIHRGDKAFIVEGKVHSILQAERLVLNIMQRMSGIATTTKTYVDKLVGTKAQVLDTRKTTPGLRYLEKLAVRSGGGGNHRMGLFDMIMLKDNHIDFAGGIEPAIKKANEYLQKNHKNIKIEIEARNLDEVKEILKVGGIDRIMFDNFNYDDTRKAIDLIDGKYETESSGGITYETIRNYAICGVDYISVN